MESPERLRVVVSSDAHDGKFFGENKTKLAELSGDINLSIGDAVSSAIRDNIVLEYKKDNAGSIAALDATERPLFDVMIAEGVIPIRAFWLSKVRAHPELLERIRQEFDENYQIFAEGLSSLPNPTLLFGNIEVGFRDNPDFENTLFNNALDQIDRIEQPRILLETEAALGVAFPSMKRDEVALQEVNIFFGELQEKIKTKPNLKSLLFFAHENLFKGPPPEHFKTSMAAAGVENYFVPFYMPNEFRKEILKFLFSVPKDIRVMFFYGHLHDTKEITQTAFPLADSEDGIGMQWGINTIDKETQLRRTRHFDMYQLPFKTIHTIDIGEEGDVVINKAE